MLQESLINGRGFWLIHTDHKRGAGDGGFPYLGTACLEPVLSSPNQSISQQVFVNYMTVSGARGYRKDSYIQAFANPFSLYTWNKISAPPRRGGKRERKSLNAQLPFKIQLPSRWQPPDLFQQPPEGLIASTVSVTQWFGLSQFGRSYSSSDILLITRQLF